MRCKTGKLLLLPLLLLTGLIIFPTSCKKDPPANSKMIIRVSYDGHPVDNVHVFTIPATSDIITDAYGLATIDGVKAGEYQVYAEAGIYTGKSIVFLGENDNQNVEVTIDFTGPISFLPQISFILPDISHAYYPGDTVALKVKVTNYKQGSQVSWSSDLDGALASTPIDASGYSVFSTSSLSKGRHKIIVKATGDEGYSTMAVRNIDMDGPQKVFLYPPEIQGDQVVLRWSRYPGDDFNFYQVNYRTYSNPDENSYGTSSFGHIIAQGDTSVTIAMPPNYYKVQFYIMAGREDGSYNISNLREMSHDLGPVFSGVPVQMMLHPQGSKVYLVFAGRTLLYDYEKKEVVASVETGSTVTFTDAGDNGDGPELYLPDKATVKVLDGNTLALKRTIPFKNDVLSVVSSGQGFLICSVMADTPAVKPLQIYSLVQQALIGEGGEVNDLLYMRKVPGKNVLAACTRRGYSAELDYFEFSSAGAITKHVDIYNASGGYSLQVMKMSPDGEYFCVGAYGNFRKTNETLDHVASLYDAYEISDYAFDETGTTAYACSPGSSIFHKYHYPSGSIAGTLSAYGRPTLLAFRGNTCIIATQTLEGGESCIELIPTGPR